MNWATFIANNPQLIGTAITTLVSGLFLPLALVYMHYYFTNAGRKREKELAREFTLEKEQVDHEKVIHSSLVKILFEVQRLYISLSCDPEDQEACVLDASKEFQNCFAKYQAIISDNQIFLESKVVNELYRFYNQVGELLIELNQIRITKKFPLARVSVYNRAQGLANIIITIQEIFVEKRRDLLGELQVVRDELDQFQECCGTPPPQELRERYRQLINQIDRLPSEE